MSKLIIGKKRIFLLAFLALVLFFSLIVNADEFVEDKNVLVIHSYHKGLAWTEGQDAGIREILGEHDQIEISTEYLDSKRFEPQKISGVFARYIAEKYANETFDAVIATDNNALTFVSEYYNRFFSGTPVVFSGINNYKPEMLKEFGGRASGVIQELEPEGTYEIIKKLQPDVENIVVVAGTTVTARAIRDEVKEALEKYEDTQNFVWLDGLNTPDLLERLSDLSPNDAVILTNFNRDAEGRYYSHEQSAKMISQASNAPVYAMEDHYLGTGIVGGNMNSSRDQGISAGRMCLAILKTGRVPEIVLSSPNVLLFDFTAMNRYGLDASLLPESALIISKRISFYEQHKTLIWETLGVFVLLLLALFVMGLGFIRARRAEKKLSQIIQKHDRLVDNLIDTFIFRFGTNGIFTYVSSSVTRVLGYTPEEFMTYSCQYLTDHPVNDDSHKYIENSIRGIQQPRREQQIYHKNGSVKWLEISENPVFDDQGKVKSVEGVAHDITERKYAEEQLRESEQRMKLWLENSPVCTKIVDLDFNLKYMSRTGVEELKIEDITEFYGKPYPLDFYPDSFKETMTDNLRKVKGTGDIVTQEAVVVDTKGNELWYHSTLVPVYDSEKKLEEIIIVSLEITDRKRAELELQDGHQRLTSIIEFLPDPTFVIDAEKKVIAWNIALEKMTGVAQKDILGKGDYAYAEPFWGRREPIMIDLVNVSDEAAASKYHVFQREENTVYSETFVPSLYRGKGAYVWCAASRLRDQNGNVIGAIESVRDITVRKQAEEEAINYRKFMDSVPGFGFAKDINFTYVSANKSFCDLLKIPYDQIKGKTDYDIFPADLAKKYIEDDRRVIETGKPIVVEEITFNAKTNQRFVVATRKHPWLDKNGNTIGIYGMGFDITEIKQTQKALQESEKKYRTIFEQSADAILILENGKFIDCNRATVEMLGYSEKSELLNTHPAELSPKFQPDERNSFKKADEMIAIAVEQGSNRFEWYHKRKNGEVFPVEVLLTSVTLEGRSFLHVVWRDITDRKHVEEEKEKNRYFLQRAQEIGQLGSWELDPVSEKMYWTDEIYSIFEIDSETVRDYKILLERIHPDDLEWIKSEWDKAVESRSQFNVEHRVVVNGKVKWVREKAELEFDKNGNYVRATGFTQDITDRKKYEKQREELVHSLEYKNKELRDIVYTASHDLRSPLVNIEGFSGELRTEYDLLLDLLAEHWIGVDKTKEIDRLLKEEIPESIQFITSGARKMSSLLDGLLQISRIGTVSINIRPLDVEKMVKEILDAMEHQKKTGDITTIIEPLPSCRGDAHMLDHVFSNLISNAIKYRDPEKKSYIKISGWVEGGKSIYCVEDNGIGIAPDYQKKIFEIFHRLNPEGPKGEGLGLTIVMRVLDRLGGRVWLESEPGIGSKFYVSLPAA